MAATPEYFTDKTLYDDLGVSSTASDEEIRAAYLRLVKDLHPDRNADPDASRAFNKVKLAYETLKDRKQRTCYDDKLRQKPAPEYTRKFTSSTEGEETAPHLKRYIPGVRPMEAVKTGEHALLINTGILPENVQAFLTGKMASPARPKDETYIEHGFNVVIVGDHGKSALYARIVHDSYTESYLSPWENQCASLYRSFGNDCVTMNLFDPTHDRRSSEWMEYQRIYAKCSHSILCVDLSSPEAITHAIWRIGVWGANNVIIAFTHSDQNVWHTQDMMDSFCKAYGVVGVVTSAKDNTGIEALVSVLNASYIAPRISARLAPEASRSESPGGFFRIAEKRPDPQVFARSLQDAVNDLDTLINSPKSTPADKAFAEKVKTHITGEAATDLSVLETIRLNNPFSRFGKLIQVHRMQDFLRNPAPDYVKEARVVFNATPLLLK